MEKVSDSEWEAICDGCGKCCSFGNNIACPSLDTATNRCRDYENRTEVQMCCVKVTPTNVPQLHRTGVLPSSCAYVRHLKGLERIDSPECAHLIPFILAPMKFQQDYAEANRKWVARETN